MIAALDIGNSALKSCFFEKTDSLIDFKNSFYNYDLPDRGIRDYLGSLLLGRETEALVFSSVVPELFDYINDYCCKMDLPLYQFLPLKQQRISLSYNGQPGADRIAALYGASCIYKEENIIVVDAGTAVNIELLQSDLSYRGGYILPGIHNLSNLLLKKASLIKEVDPFGKSSEPGNSTASCLSNGVTLFYKGGVEALIKEGERVFPEGFRLLVTGGDRELLGGLVGGAMLVDDLVLRGCYYAYKNGDLASQKCL
jgi:pantothenate kinase type III